LLDWIWAFGLRLWAAGVVLILVNLVSSVVLYANRAGWKSFAAAQLVQGLIAGFSARRLREMSVERKGFAYLCTVPAANGAGAIAKLIQLGGEPRAEWRARHFAGVPDFAPPRFRPFLAVALLTIRAAFRFRLVVTLLGLLLAVVFVLPGVIKHDGSAQGFTQILITYTLAVITAPGARKPVGVSAVQAAVGMLVACSWTGQAATGVAVSPDAPHRKRLGASGCSVQTSPAGGSRQAIKPVMAKPPPPCRQPLPLCCTGGVTLAGPTGGPKRQVPLPPPAMGCSGTGRQLPPAGRGARAWRLIPW
jgi:hypothetical protein